MSGKFFVLHYLFYRSTLANREVLNIRCVFCAVIWILVGLSLLACDNEDLSDLNDRYQAKLAAGAFNVEFRVEFITAQLTADEVGNGEEQEIQFTFNTGTNELSGGFSVSQELDESIQSVELWRGHIGSTGSFIQRLRMVDMNPGRWHLSDTITLGNEDADQLFSGGLYILVNTDQQGTGPLRAQLLPDWQQLLVNSLTPEQVVDGPDTTSGSARSVLILDVLDKEIRGIVHHSTDVSPLNLNGVNLYAGAPGQSGQRVFSFHKDPDNPRVWRIPETHRELDENEFRQLGTAGLYVQISTSAYTQGELRTQIYSRKYLIFNPAEDEYFPAYDILTVRLSDEALQLQTPLDASGKAYVTIEYDDDDPVIHGIVRIKNMTAGRVALVRIANENNPSIRSEISPLLQQGDYWQLPEGEEAVSLNERNRNALNQGKLYFIATYDGGVGGEIAGRLSLDNDNE